MKTFDGFMKGVNLGGWLSQCDYSRERLNGFITEKDIASIASWGLDHVRLPIDYNVLEAEGGYSPEGFGHVQRAVDWCKRYGLNIVLDLHKTAGFSFHAGYAENGFFDSPALQERFCALWEQIACMFGDDPEHIAFELLNEVTDKSYMPRWMEIAKAAFERIRAHAPETRILLGGYWNNSVEAVKDLDAPWDENVVYNFHCYDPMLFTHQRASWVRNTDVNRDVSYLESGADEKYFEERFASALDAAQSRGAALYCGEYGVIENATPEDTLKWYKAINAVLTRHNIARAAWSYKQMNFGLSDKRLDGVREELIKYL